MKVSKTEIRFKTGFIKPKTGFPKKTVLTSLIYIHINTDQLTGRVSIRISEKLMPLYVHVFARCKTKIDSSLQETANCYCSSNTSLT